MSSDHPTVAQVGLVSLFVTALVTAQVTASKVLAFGLPFSLPVAGEALVLPGAALAYAVTFFASDCYTELYGKRAAQVVVNVGFFMNFVLLLLVWSTIAAPVAGNSPVGAGAFQQVLGASTGVVVASLLAYLVSQNWDVIVFHRIRELTDGDALWLRNVGSTATSQLLDTVIFVTVAFVVFQGVPLELALSLMVGQYLFKLLIAVVDTPFVYLVVAAVRSRNADLAEPAVAD
ncbi:queuosine precursor transporter [Halorientalis salina]|uniref:queuosine precursor transporter n=1 Tax=Halorientalis salina TaxID=2932266 RepID=UPI0010ACCA23|nr:queuosine precursor transporter [Halorientalis salina]